MVDAATAGRIKEALRERKSTADRVVIQWTCPRCDGVLGVEYRRKYLPVPPHELRAYAMRENPCPCGAESN